MADEGWLIEEFEANRARLRSVAYRMLGSHAEADDAVQETWLRLARTDAETVDNLGGWLTTVVGRICLDRLRARRARGPAASVDALHDRPAGPERGPDPAHESLLAESIGAALLVVLDVLGPAERVAFVLHDVFAVPFDEVAEIVGRSPEATRQLASRARRRVQGTGPTRDLDLVRHREVVDAFLRAARDGDFDSLLRLLDPDVVLQPDEAALGMGSLRRTQGATAVAGALSGGAQTARLAIVDGVTALVWAPRADEVRGVIELTVVDGRIVALDVTGDAARIASFDIVVLDV